MGVNGKDIELRTAYAPTIIKLANHPMASILKILKRNYQKNHGTEPEGVVEGPAEPEG